MRRFERLLGIYGRIWPLIRALPFVAALPLLFELLQHAVEIAFGFYASTGAPTSTARHIRIAFGAVKVVALIVTIVAALRWWSFRGNRQRALRPTWRLGKGLAAYALVETLGDILQYLIQQRIEGFLGASRTVTLVGELSLLLVWVFVSGLWLPWYVALLVEDPRMTFLRSVQAVGGGLVEAFGYVCGGIVPLMALHYALGYAALHRAARVVWLLNGIDALVVVVLAVAIASSFYTVYLWAGERCRLSGA